jgi:hypothetical protein
MLPEDEEAAQRAVAVPPERAQQLVLVWPAVLARSTLLDPPGGVRIRDEEVRSLFKA